LHKRKKNKVLSFKGTVLLVKKICNYLY